MGYQSIYNQLRASGLTEAGALALLGNWDCESNCESNRLQGDFSPYRNMSRQYTAGVDDGSISKKQFMGDSKGYGLAQWTFWSRKAGLYDYCRQRGGSISSEALQVEYAIKEMPSEASGLLEELKTSNDLYQCVKDVCYKFEKPAVMNVDARFQSANRIKAQIHLDPPAPPDPPSPPEPGPEPPKPEPTKYFWPPRTIDYHCADWPEVAVLGAVLYCRGYIDYAADAWNDEVTQAVEDFQFDNGLKKDGVVGPSTWKMLFEMG